MRICVFRFSRGEEAQAAIANLDGKHLENSMFPLSVRVAEDHSRQKAQILENQALLLNRGESISFSQSSISLGYEN